MNLDYVPVLQVQRDFHVVPRNMSRFRQYLRTIVDQAGTGLELPPLVLMNPMGKDHVTALLDALLAQDADGVAGRTVAEAAAALMEEPGDCKVALVVVDDLKGGWTNRYTTEFNLRFPSAAPGRVPRWLKCSWITAALWSSEAATERAVREAVLTSVYRMAYLQRHGPARTLRDKLAQEGHVMALAGCTGPTLDPDDIDYTRTVLAPYLEADDMRTAIECLFGDAAAATLGFTPHGLSPQAGLALALHDAANSPANAT